MNLHLDAGRVHFPYEGTKDKRQLLRLLSLEGQGNAALQELIKLRIAEGIKFR